MHWRWAIAAIAFVVAIAGSRVARAQDEGGPTPHAPVTMRVGLVVTELNRLDLSTGAFAFEVIARIHCDRDPCNPTPDVANGRLTARPDLIHDEPLYKVVRLKGEAGTPIDFAEYPFDSHALAIVIEDKKDPEQVVYVPDAERTSIASDVKLPGWDVSRWTATPAVDDLGEGRGIAQIHFAIEARRPLRMAMARAIAPLVAMVFVAILLALIRPRSAAARLNAALVGFASLVMFHVAELAALPPLGYLTRFDKLMMATYLVYLVHIALSVAMLRFDRKEDARRAQLAYAIAAGAVPGLALFVWTAVLARLV